MDVILIRPASTRQINMRSHPSFCSIEQRATRQQIVDTQQFLKNLFKPHLPDSCKFEMTV